MVTFLYLLVFLFRPNLCIAAYGAGVRCVFAAYETALLSSDASAHQVAGMQRHNHRNLFNDVFQPWILGGVFFLLSNGLKIDMLVALVLATLGMV